MEINNIGKSNFKDDKVKRNSVPQKQPDIKSFETSSLEALDSHGRAMINMSFKGQMQSPEASIKLSDEDFLKLKKQAEEIVKSLDFRVRQNALYMYNQITKENIFLIMKILSDERLYNNSDFMMEVEELVQYTDTSQIAQDRIDILDFVLSDDNLLNNEVLKYMLCEIVSSVYTPEQKQIALKFLSDERFSSNEEFIEMTLPVIIRSTEAPELADARIKLVDKLLSIEQLASNESFVNKVGNIASMTVSPQQAQNKIDFANKILSDERLCNNPNFMSAASDILLSVYNNESVKAKSDYLDKVLSDERLCDNPSFMEFLSCIICDIKTNDDAKSAIIFTDRILENENLLYNSAFLSKANKIILSLKTPVQAQIAEEVLADDNLSSNDVFMTYVSDVITNAEIGRAHV